MKFKNVVQNAVYFFFMAWNSSYSNKSKNSLERETQFEF